MPEVVEKDSHGIVRGKQCNTARDQSKQQKQAIRGGDVTFSLTKTRDTLLIGLMPLWMLQSLLIGATQLKAALSFVLMGFSWRMLL